MLEARSLPDSPEGWGIFIAALVVWVAVFHLLPERFSSGWRRLAVSAVIVVLMIGAFFALDA
jgi:hypothetical protein